MERDKRNDMSLSKKRSFTFGAYGRWVALSFEHKMLLVFKEMGYFQVETILIVEKSSSHFLVYSVDRITCGDETRWGFVSPRSYFKPVWTSFDCEEQEEGWQIVSCCWCKPTCCFRLESEENELQDSLDSPASDSKPSLSSSSNQRVRECPRSHSVSTHLINPPCNHCHIFVQLFMMFLFLPTFLLPFFFLLEPPVHFLSQETELFEIIAKLQVSFSGIDLVCASSRCVCHRWCSCLSGQPARWAKMWIPTTSEG